MSYKSEIKEQAIQLRKNGNSLKEISEKLHIAKSTSSAWLSHVRLSKIAQTKLAKKQILGQYKTVLIKAKQKKLQTEALEKDSIVLLKRITPSKELAKLCCALLWWCEGNKRSTFVRFTNSDPSLIKNFLLLLRFGFKVEESKFRILMHLHKYHSEVVQKEFWSEVTGISKKQFNRSYLKPNTGKRLHEAYPGCIAVSYYDSKIAKELEALYNSFTNKGVFVNGKRAASKAAPGGSNPSTPA